jgi:hypothetical protein
MREIPHFGFVQAEAGDSFIWVQYPDNKRLYVGRPTR